MPTQIYKINSLCSPSYFLCLLPSQQCLKIKSQQLPGCCCANSTAHQTEECLPSPSPTSRPPLLSHPNLFWRTINLLSILHLCWIMRGNSSSVTEAPLGYTKGNHNALENNWFYPSWMKMHNIGYTDTNTHIKSKFFVQLCWYKHLDFIRRKLKADISTWSVSLLFQIIVSKNTN